MRHRTSIGDLGVLAAVAAVLLFVTFSFDVFLHEGQVSLREQTIELDEILLFGVVLSLGLLLFAMRRHHEQKREMRRRQEAERHVRELAFQDPLTGLPNRRQFEDALKMAVAQPPAANSSHAVMMLDLNGFKRINDTFGHAAGDEVLVVVAQRLLSAVRSEDLVARLGGDEFVVLAPHVLGPEGAANIASRIVNSLSAPVGISGKEHQVGSGIGIALLPDDAADATEVLRKADVALYRAKEEHRSAIRFFEPQMDLRIHQRDALERALLTAIRNEEIEARFRPTIDLGTGGVLSFEVSPFWMSSDGEEIAPERFLAIAEETGLVHELGSSLLARALAAAKDWPDHVGLSIDLLPGQITDPKLGTSILASLQAAGMPPARLDVEVAENMVVANLDAARNALAPLRAAGVKITLDKFGTGYSNLYHLQEFAFDKVKIDRRFTERIGHQDADRVVKALAGLGQGLGMVVGADGLSSPGTRDSLLGSGVSEAQTEGVFLSANEARLSFAVGNVSRP